MADCLDIEEHNILDNPIVKKILAANNIVEEAECNLQDREESPKAVEQPTSPIPEQSGQHGNLLSEAKTPEAEKQTCEKEVLLVEPDSTTGLLSNINSESAHTTEVSAKSAETDSHTHSDIDDKYTAVVNNTTSDNKNSAESCIICLDVSDEEHIETDKNAGANVVVPDSTIALDAAKCNVKDDATNTVPVKLINDNVAAKVHDAKVIVAKKVERDKNSRVVLGKDRTSTINKTRVKKSYIESKSVVIRGARVGWSQIERLGKVTVEVAKIMNAKVLLTDVGASLVYTDLYCVECSRLFCLRKDLSSHRRKVHGDIDFDKRPAGECRNRDEERIQNVNNAKKTQNTMSDNILGLEKKRLKVKKRKADDNAINDYSDEISADSDLSERNKVHYDNKKVVKSTVRAANKNSIELKKPNDTNTSTQTLTATKKSAAAEVVNDALPSTSSNKGKHNILKISSSRGLKNAPNPRSTLCFHCNVNFEAKDDLIAHMYDILMKKTFKCESCLKTFETEKAFGLHSKACPKDRKNSNAMNKVDKLVKKKLKIKRKTAEKDLKQRSEMTLKERKLSKTTNKIDRLLAKKQNKCNSVEKASIKKRKDALVTKKSLHSNKVVNSFEQSPENALDKTDEFSKNRQNKCYPPKKGKKNDWIKVSIPVTKNVSDETAHSKQSNKGEQAEKEGDNVQNSENATKLTIEKEAPCESDVTKEASAGSLLKHGGNTADIDVVSAVNSSRETVIKKITIQSKALDGATFTNKADNKQKVVKIHNMKSVIGDKVDSLFCTKLMPADKKETISDYVKSKIRKLHTVNEKRTKSSKTDYKLLRKRSKETQANVVLKIPKKPMLIEKLGQLLDNLDLDSSKEPVSDKDLVKSAVAKETDKSVIGAETNDGVPCKKPRTKLIDDICAEWQDLKEVQKVPQQSTSNNSSCSEQHQSLPARTPDATVKDEVTIKESLSDDDENLTDNDTAHLDVSSERSKPVASSKNGLSTKISRLIDSLPTDIGISGAVSISEIMDASTDRSESVKVFPKRSNVDWNPMEPQTSSSSFPHRDVIICNPKNPQTIPTTTVATSISRVPNSVLFKCRRCPLHFTKAFSACRHLSKCPDYAYVHKASLPFNVQSEKCVKCDRSVWSPEMPLHLQQHKLTGKFGVITITSARSLDRLLFYCHKCGVHYSEDRFYEHECAVKQNDSIYCRECDAILDGTMVKHVSMHTFGTLGPEDFVTVFFDDCSGVFPQHWNAGPIRGAITD